MQFIVNFPELSESEINTEIAEKEIVWWRALEIM